MGTARVQAGVGIAYHLRPSDRPTNPERLWHGIVTEVYTQACRVRLTEPDYEDLDEMIFFEQILYYYHSTPQKNTGDPKKDRQLSNYYKR
jgi:hypothetical protein